MVTGAPEKGHLPLAIRRSAARINSGTSSPDTPRSPAISIVGSPFTIPILFPAPPPIDSLPQEYRLPSPTESNGSHGTTEEEHGLLSGRGFFSAADGNLSDMNPTPSQESIDQTSDGSENIYLVIPRKLRKRSQTESKHGSSRLSQNYEPPSEDSRNSRMSQMERANARKRSSSLGTAGRCKGNKPVKTRPGSGSRSKRDMDLLRRARVSTEMQAELIIQYIDQLFPTSPSSNSDVSLDSLLGDGGRSPSFPFSLPPPPPSDEHESCEKPSCPDSPPLFRAGTVKAQVSQWERRAVTRKDSPGIRIRRLKKRSGVEVKEPPQTETEADTDCENWQTVESKSGDVSPNYSHTEILKEEPPQEPDFGPHSPEPVPMPGDDESKTSVFDTSNTESGESLTPVRSSEAVDLQKVAQILLAGGKESHHSAVHRNFSESLPRALATQGPPRETQSAHDSPAGSRRSSEQVKPEQCDPSPLEPPRSAITPTHKGLFSFSRYGKSQASPPPSRKGSKTNSTTMSIQSFFKAMANLTEKEKDGPVDLQKSPHHSQHTSPHHSQKELEHVHPSDLLPKKSPVEKIFSGISGMKIPKTSNPPMSPETSEKEMSPNPTRRHSISESYTLSTGKAVGPALLFSVNEPAPHPTANAHEPEEPKNRRDSTLVVEFLRRGSRELFSLACVSAAPESPEDDSPKRPVKSPQSSGIARSHSTSSRLAVNVGVKKRPSTAGLSSVSLASPTDATNRRTSADSKSASLLPIYSARTANESPSPLPFSPGVGSSISRRNSVSPDSPLPPPPVNVEALLMEGDMHKEVKADFFRFLDEEMSRENILYYYKCKRFLQRLEKNKATPRDAEGLYREFIGEDATNEVNIPSKLRKNITDAMVALRSTYNDTSQPLPASAETQSNRTFSNPPSNEISPSVSPTLSRSPTASQNVIPRVDETCPWDPITGTAAAAAAADTTRSKRNGVGTGFSKRRSTYRSTTYSPEALKNVGKAFEIARDNLLHMLQQDTYRRFIRLRYPQVLLAAASPISPDIHHRTDFSAAA